MKGLRRGLYPQLAGILLCLYLLAVIFEEQYNALNPIIQQILFVVGVIIILAVILLALWDTRIIGKDD